MVLFTPDVVVTPEVWLGSGRACLPDRRGPILRCCPAAVPDFCSRFSRPDRATRY